MSATPTLFPSFFMGGFECSTHVRADGRRLDVIDATRHDRFVREDYQRLRDAGILAARDGIRWHRVEADEGPRDWSSFLPMLRAARDLHLQVVWDLCHYGWPDGLDIWSEAFIQRFAAFSAAAARLVLEHTGPGAWYCPVNEISFWAWAGGDEARFNPCTRGRAGELKRQLVRAALASMRAIRDVDPTARFLHGEPVIQVMTPPDRIDLALQAAIAHAAQYEAWDMIAGARDPELGGAPSFLDVIGVNFYSDNQWYWGAGTVEVGDPLYRPFRELLGEVYRRYHRPMIISETGAEGAARTPWLRYVADEVRAARAEGIPVEAICLYPILNYPGWADDRHCEAGLWCRADDRGHRERDPALAAELARQQARGATAPASPVRVARPA